MPGIRDQLAAEDLQFRRDNDGRLLERLFAVNVYHNAYQGMWLDKYAELDRWRRAGVQTPAPRPKGSRQTNPGRSLSRIGLEYRKSP